MAKKYAGRGVVILGVATHNASLETVRQWLSARPVSYPILVDRGRQYYDLYQSYTAPGIRAPFPRHVVIGPDGRVLAAMSSYRPDVLARLFEGSAPPRR